MAEDSSFTNDTNKEENDRLAQDIAKKIEEHKKSGLENNNYAVISELDTSKQVKQISVISSFAMIFAFIVPPVGFILAAIAENKAIKIDYKKRVFIYLALVISSLLTIALVALGVLYFNQILKNSLSNKSKNNIPQQNQASSTSQPSRTSDENNSIEITNNFLNYLKTENYSAAYELLGPELKKEYPGGVDQFSKEVSAANLKLINTWDINKVSSNDKKDRIDIGGNVTFNASSSNGSILFNYYKDKDGSIKMNSWQVTAL